MVMNLPAFSSRDLDFDSPNGGHLGPQKGQKNGNPHEEVTTSSEPGDLVASSDFLQKHVYLNQIGSFPQTSGGKHDKQIIFKVSHQQQHHHQSAYYFLGRIYLKHHPNYTTLGHFESIWTWSSQ